MVKHKTNAACVRDLLRLTSALQQRLARLAPGASYPPHTHAGVEELHLLDGEVWIDQRKLFPGDYDYGPPGPGTTASGARPAAPVS